MAPVTLTGTVNIASYTVYSDDVIADDALFNIYADARLVLLGDDQFSDDSIAMDGQLRNRGTLAVDDGLTLLNSSVLVNAATVAQSGGELRIGQVDADAATVRNIAGATWELAGNAGLTSVSSSRFVNFGVFEQNTNTGTNIVNANFYNHGVVEVGAGALQFEAVTRLFGDVSGAGSVVATDVALIGTKISVANFSVSGTANVVGRVVCTSAADIPTVGLAANSRLVLTGADTNAQDIYGAGTVVLKGTAEISALTLSGDATLINAGSVEFGGHFGAILTANPSGEGSVTIRNLPGATWTDNGMGSMELKGPNIGATFVNLGTFVEFAFADAIIGMNFVNDGVVEISSGAGGIQVEAPITGTGAIEMDDHALTVNSRVGSGQTVDFTTTASGLGTPALDLDDVVQFFGQIAGFGADDAIAVNSSTWSYKDFAPNTDGTGGSLVFVDGVSEKDIRLVGSYDPSGFHASYTGSRTIITYGGP